MTSVATWKMPFGKYKSQSFKSIVDEDPSYARWLIENVYIPKDDKYKENTEKIRAYLQSRV